MPEKDRLKERCKNYALFLEYLEAWLKTNHDRILAEAYKHFQEQTGLTV